jgi:transcriptional regulator with XRE-family HTH domain
MTQEEFAERIGISQNYLSTMERGKGRRSCFGSVGNLRRVLNGC